MEFKTRSLTLLSVATLLAATACTPASTETSDVPSTTAQATENADHGAADTGASDTDAATTPSTGDGTAGYDLAEIVRRIGDGYERVDGDWPGFVPNDHPAVLALKDSSGDLAGALAFNFPDPDALGTARALDPEGTPIGSVHHITELTEAEKLQNLRGFDFHLKIGGVDSFAMEAGGGDDFFVPTTNDYVATYLHEMFHRWQDDGFAGDLGSQDVEGYAYTPENLALAALEDRALIEAANAETDEVRREAARRFAGIRLARMAADPRVANLDNSQERFEGTARYIEHRVAGTDEDFSNYNETDYSVELASDPSATGGVKDHYGFGRFYATGASILGLLDALGADDVDDEIEGGLSPAETLIEFLGVSEEDADDLVADAKSSYDPLGELEDAAAKAAKAAEDEPPVFGDEDFPGGEDGAGVGDASADEGGAGEAIGDAEIECLEENGIELGDPVPQEVFEKCVGS